MFIHVSPQSTANKYYIIDNFHITFEEVDVRKLSAFVSEILNTLNPFTIIKFMVTGNINHMRELESTPLEEVTEPCHSLLFTAKICKRTVTIRVKVKVWMVVQILSDHDVTTQDQHVTLVIVSDVNVTEL